MLYYNDIGSLSLTNPGSEGGELYSQSLRDDFPNNRGARKLAIQANQHFFSLLLNKKHSRVRHD